MNEGGIACFWLQLYCMNPDDIKMILATISQVFPEMEIWFSNVKTDCIIICSEKPLSFKYDRFIGAYNTSQRVKNYIKFSDLNHPDEFLSSYITDGKSLESLIYGSKINTDDLLYLEYSAPISLYLDSSITNIGGLFNYKTNLLPKLEGSPNLSSNYYAKGFEFSSELSQNIPNKFLQEGLKLHPEDTSLNIHRIQSLILKNHQEFAEKELDRLIKDNSNNFIYLNFKAELLTNKKLYSQAETVFDTIFNSKLNTGLLGLNFCLKYIFCLEKQGKYDKVISIADYAITKFNDPNFYLAKFQALEKLNINSEAMTLIPELLKTFSPVIYEDVAKFYLKQNDLENAFKVAWRYYNFSNHDIKSSEILINVLDRQGRHEDARAVAIEALSNDPYNKLFTETISKVTK